MRTGSPCHKPYERERVKNVGETGDTGGRSPKKSVTGFRLRDKRKE